MIAKRAKNRIERWNVAGESVPPMVGYQSKSIYKYLVRSGPANTVYDCTIVQKNRWFDSHTFGVWFFKQFLPSIEHLSGPTVLIGDNLGSHCSSSVIQECMAHDIFFISLLPNATHLCQSLDVTASDLLKLAVKTYSRISVMSPDDRVTYQKQFFPPVVQVNEEIKGT